MPSLELEGADKFIKRLRKASKDAPKLLARGMNVEAEKIMTKAKRNTPVDTGTLRASGHVRSPVLGRRSVTIELGFGGAASAYALAVHEHPSEHSPPSWSGGVSFGVGGPKYLERAVRDSAKSFGRNIARNVDLF